MIVSGFLGAGKTTTMIALTEYINKNLGKASIIVNDLGAKNLVDAEYTAATGCPVTEITGECVCYQIENLVDKLRRLRDIQNADIVMSDIHGFGVGALNFVYHRFREDYDDDFELAPFLVIVDPARLRMIMPEKADIGLPAEIAYLLNTQLMEADAVVLNKIDILNEGEVDKYVNFLKDTCPGTPVFAISAKQKKNIDEVAEHVMSHKSGLKTVDIGYGGPDFIAAESKLCWYNRRFFIKTWDGSKIDGNEFISDFVEKLRSELVKNKRNIPHLKIFAIGGDSDFGKVSLLGVDYDPEFDKKTAAPNDKFRVIVNARATCESSLLSPIMDNALAESATKHNVECQVFFTECFGMMDEGRA
jgi:Ni2+-binding GTPase involved in maturation of urease and hydrogenase